MPRSVQPKSAAALPYFRPEALTFLQHILAKHNDRAWFQPLISAIETELKEPMLAADSAKLPTRAMADFAPNHVRPAEKSLFRIYRDTRFSRKQASLQSACRGVVVAPRTREDFGCGLLLSRQRERSHHRRRRLHAGKRSGSPPFVTGCSIIIVSSRNSSEAQKCGARLRSSKATLSGARRRAFQASIQVWI